MFDTNERKYIAISIKHSIYDSSTIPVMWGCKRTADNEERCFSGYTSNPYQAEVYSLDDFLNSYGNSFIKCDEPVEICFDYKKKYKKYDTVLVDETELLQFLKFV